MKLCRFKTGGLALLGVVLKDRVVDLASLGCAYRSMLEIVENAPQSLEEISTLLKDADGGHLLSQVTLLAPIEKPGKYLAIGMNYKKHQDEAAKMGIAAPQAQVWFNKQTTCINDPYGPIEMGVTQKLDYEVELGLVIGKSAKHVDAANALDYVFGYFVANDVSARDWQFHSPTFTMGKSFDTHGPIGPWIVTADEILDPQNLDLECYVNGELRQSNNTSAMIHNIASQIAYLSTAFTLEPGDLLATGTPEGVGVAMEPQCFLQVGDVVRCTVEGIGAIENTVVK